MNVEEAWEHVRALWPDATHMTKFVMENNFSITSIDWPEGVTQWPPKEPEPAYETPRILEHWGLECEFRDDENDVWVISTLRGYVPGANKPWGADSWTRWRYARIRASEEKRVKP